jgi:LemA protein
MTIIYILIAIIVLALLAFIGIYNNFVHLRNRTDEAWADIDVQLKRRYDLIPNLVNTVRGYMTHEATTLEKVTAARTMAMGANGLHDKSEAENMLSGALKSLFAVSENYPDLKANTNFLELQRELTDTENKIQAARRFYNTNVRDLNIAVEAFPSNIVAGMIKTTKREFFELGEGEQDAKNPVEVKF